MPQSKFEFKFKSLECFAQYSVLSKAAGTHWIKLNECHPFIRSFGITKRTNYHGCFFSSIALLSVVSYGYTVVPESD